MKKTIQYFTVTACAVVALTACNAPAGEDKEKMYANAKRMSDSIQVAIDNALNSASITPSAQQPAADTTKK